MYILKFSDQGLFLQGGEYSGSDSPKHLSLYITLSMSSTFEVPEKLNMNLCGLLGHMHNTQILQAQALYYIYVHIHTHTHRNIPMYSAFKKLVR